MVKTVNFVDKENVALVEVGENSREVARFFYEGPDVTFICTPISAAMMCASVVLPSPGGP